jgi:mRNA-degrading endonuclease RelE of RelBE toxin-antitoxin system
MSLAVVVQETALRTLARIRSQDKEAFATIRQALSALADQPRTDQAVAWGGSGIYRLHLPGVRIPYEIDESAATVYIINVARTREDHDRGQLPAVFAGVCVHDDGAAHLAEAGGADEAWLWGV